MSGLYLSAGLVLEALQSSVGRHSGAVGGGYSRAAGLARRGPVASPPTRRCAAGMLPRAVCTRV